MALKFTMNHFAEFSVRFINTICPGVFFLASSYQTSGQRHLLRPEIMIPREVEQEGQGAKGRWGDTSQPPLPPTPTPKPTPKPESLYSLNLY